MTNPPILIAIACLVSGLAYFLINRQVRTITQRQRQRYDERLKDLEAGYNQQLLDLEKQRLQAQEYCKALEQDNLTLQHQIETLKDPSTSGNFETLEALKAQKTQLNQELHTLEKQLDDERLHRQLLLDEKEAIAKKCQALRQQQDELQQYKTKLEESLYQLMSQEEFAHRSQQSEQKIQALQQDIDRLQKNLDHNQRMLQDQLDHEANLRRISIVSACHHLKDEGDNLFHVKIDTQFDTVIHAVEFAEYLFGDVLEIWDSARESAYQSNFIRPHDVYINLQALAWLGRDYFERQGNLGRPIYEYLQQLGCAYSGESDTVENDAKLLNDRKFWHSDGATKIMLEHLKVGTGRGTNKNLRIYFALNLDKQRVEIGHCGNHKRLRST